MVCVFKKIVKTRENFRIYVHISGANSNFRTFQDKFQNFRTTPRPVCPAPTALCLVCREPGCSWLEWADPQHDSAPQVIRKQLHETCIVFWRLLTSGDLDTFWSENWQISCPGERSCKFWFFIAFLFLSWQPVCDRWTTPAMWPNRMTE